MCFGDKLKGEDHSARINNDHPRPVHSISPPTSISKMPNPNPNNYNDAAYTPPTAPPSSMNFSPEFSPPSGPPPSHLSALSGPPSSHFDYAPPPGPPPNHDGYSSPPGPPPKQEPYHDWQNAVPDTSLLPPPPAMGNQRSATNNATEQEAERGESWCQSNPLRGPLYLPAEALNAIQAGEIGIIKPQTYKGTLERPRPGVWQGKTKANCEDNCITSSVPLYSAIAHSPLQTGRPKTIYFEVRINRTNRNEVSLAMGFAAPPYPNFRLPGWHRGSLAIHGDDGSKFINDLWGGNDFTAPFKAGETLGVGMTLAQGTMNNPPAYGQTAVSPIDVEIFFTRDGRKVGGWNLHGERDAVEDLEVTGLEGQHDLYAAVGTFDKVDFEIVFSQGEWMYHP